MKVLQINATCGKGSTGKICKAISEVLFQNGIDNRIAYSIGSSDYKYAFKFSDNNMLKCCSAKEHLNGKLGFVANKSTDRLIKYIDNYKPDIIHLHNIHSHDIDLKTLFIYLRESNKKVYWTFHDCWAFTGYCMYFDMVNCSAWKADCKNCPQKRKFSLFFDKSEWLHKQKKMLFDSLDMTIITPSEWLAKLTKQSFLFNKPIKVINNGIDLDVFYPKESNFKELYSLKNKKIILGVADIWDERKGLDVFLKLSTSLKNEFKLVLVGTSEKIDRKLPKSIISIHRTSNQQELSELYSAASVFLNPTREDNYPTVNMESIACGTPVITFNTGGSAEIINSETGWVVEKNDISSILQILNNMQDKSVEIIEKCKKYAENFDMKNTFYKYLHLYKEEMVSSDE